MYSHPLGAAQKQRRLSSLKLPLLRTCNGILADVERKCALSTLHVSFAKKEQMALLICMSTRDRLQKMLERKNRYDFQMVFAFAAAPVDKSVGFEANFDLTRFNVQYTDTVYKVLVHYNEVLWM